MPLLNPPDILPEAMRYLLRALIAHKGGTCQKAELLALVSPDGLAEVLKPLDTGREAEPDGDNTSTSGRIIAERSLDALVTLKLAIVAGPTVSTTEAALQQWSTASSITALSFRRVIRGELWRSIDEDQSAGVDLRAGDLVQALALLYSTPEPMRPFQFETGNGRQFVDPQTERYGPNKRDWPVTNKEQWMTMRRWAPYLGLAQHVPPQAIIADGSRALLEDLGNLGAGRYSISTFVARCAAVLPICDGGSQSNWASPDGQELSPGLSMSLRQLEVEGHLDIKKESDIDLRVIAIGGERDLQVPASHIDWHPRLSEVKR
jgi:hypothetical protein